MADTEGIGAERILVLTLHAARKKARAAAEAEVISLLESFEARRLSDGPRSEVSGTAWVGVRTRSSRALQTALRCLGYSSRVELAEPVDATRSHPGGERARWRGQHYSLKPLYREAIQDLQRDAPDRRSFLLECGDGEVRPILGYRGGRGPLEHRALPVYDARLVVNLLGPASAGVVLDPFAGAGSIVLFARRAGWRTVALDRDPSLRFGLAELAAHSAVGDAGHLPLRARCVERVATEPPYDRRATDSVCRSITEAARVLKPGGRMVLFVAAEQADTLLESAQASGLSTDLDVEVDRRGMSVRCLRMRSPDG